MNINNGGGAGGGGGSSNASVGSSNGSTTAPTSATEIGYVDGSGFLQPVSPTTPLPAVLEPSTNVIGKVGIDQTTPGTTNGVQVNAALPAGTNLIGKTGIDQTTPGTTNGVVLNAGANIAGKFGIDQTTPGTTNGVQVNAALPAGTNLLGKVGIDQTTPGTTNAVADTTGLNIQGTVAAGVAATKSALAGQVYNSTVPTVTNGQQIAMQSDPYGNHLVISPDLYITGQGAQTTLNNNVILASAGSGSTDALGYHSGTVQLICPAGTYTTGAVIFEGSNDNVNFATIPVYNQIILTGTPISADITLVTTTSIVYTFPIQTRYIRCRISTAITGASAQVQAFTKLSIAAWSPTVMQVAQVTAANLSTTATVASGTITAVTTANVTPFKGTITDGSGTTSATPSTATTAAAVNASRKYLFIQNCSSSATVWINFTTTAVASQPSIPLLPYAAYVQETGFVSTELISIISTAASVPYVLKQS